MAETRNGQLDGEAIRVIFNPSSPRINDGIGSVLLKVLVEKATGGPYGGATVQFFSGQDPIAPPTQTDTAGHARALAANLAPGDHAVSVRVGDVEVPFTVTVDPNAPRGGGQPQGRQQQRGRQRSQSPSEVYGVVDGQDVTLMLQKSITSSEVILSTIFIADSGESMEGREIEFTWAGESLGQQPTSAQGAARMPVPLGDKSPGTYPVIAHVAGTGLVARDNVTVTASKTLLPNLIDVQEISNRSQYGEARFLIRLLRKEGNGSQGVKGRVLITGFEDGSEQYVDVNDIGGVVFPADRHSPLRHTRAIEYTFSADNVVDKEKVPLDRPARYPDPPPLPPGLGFWGRWDHRLRYNNNWRSIFCWLLFVVLIVMQTHFYGCGAPRDQATIEAERYKNLSEIEKYYADHWRQTLGVSKPQESSALTKRWIELGGWTWWILTRLLLPWCIFYMFWVMRDEIWGTVEDARRMYRERREGIDHSTSGPQGRQIVNPEVPFSWTKEIGANFLERAVWGFFRKLF